MLRERFLAADVGITGANFLVAETGTSVIVTNEGNGDLTQILPRVHIVLAAIEKITPTLEDVSQILRLLARSATGQDMSVYTTFSTGPRRPGDPDGPEEYHVVILDNGRSAMLGSEFQDMLRCIRCGACMNHCPVYQAVGGHAYGWVYPGPMGAVLTPTLIGIDKAGPPAQRLDLLRALRGGLPDAHPAAEDDAPLARARVRAAPVAARRSATASASGPSSPSGRGSISSRPRLAMRVLANRGIGRGRFRSLPLAGGWTKYPRLPGAAGPDVPGSMWARAEERHERARRGPRQDPPLARRQRPTTPAGGPSSSPGSTAAEGRDPEARPARARRARRAFCSDGRKIRRHHRPRVPAPAMTCRKRWRNIFARRTCRRGSAWASDPALAGLPWRRRTIDARVTGLRRRSTRSGSAMPRPASPRPGRWCLPRARTTRDAELPARDPRGGARSRGCRGRLRGRLAKLRARYGKGVLPRTVNMITGPSRSGDIQQTLILGAHGPRRLHIVLVG